MHVALTGGIASGKTTVSDRWAGLGAVVIDSDVLAREVVEPGTPGLAAVVGRFGEKVLDGDRLDRRALGAIVFADAVARADLERILHPLIRQRASEIVAAQGEDRVVVQVVPLLVETAQQEDFDAVVVVDVPVEVQVARTMARDGLDEAQARARVAAQASRRQRLDVADLVIDNSSDREHLLAEADRVWAELRARL